MADQDHPFRPLFYVLVASSLYACSGSSYSFSPSADPAPSTGIVMSGGVAGDGDALGGRNAGGTIDGASPNDARAIDVNVGTVQRDSGSSDTMSDRVESKPPDASNPILATGLLLWLSADVDVSEKGGNVANWGDRSGNGNDARQMDEALRPSLDSSWHNGHPALEFDGVSQFLELPSSFNDFNSGISIFVVGDVSGSASCPSFVHFSNGLENEDIALHLQNSNNFTYEVADESFDAAADTAPANRPLLLGVIQWPNQQARIFANGVPSGQRTMKLPVQIHRVRNDIGRSSYADCALLEGHIAEIILYRRALDDPERTNVEAYLRAKWNL